MPKSVKQLGKSAVSAVKGLLQPKEKGKADVSSKNEDDNEPSGGGSSRLLPQESNDDTMTGISEDVSTITANPERGNEAVADAMKNRLAEVGVVDSNLTKDIDSVPFDWKVLADKEASNCEAVRRVQIKDIDKNDIIIVIMGSTGVGKSSFIQAAARAFSGNDVESSTISHDLETGTKTIDCLSIAIPNTPSKLILVDTPGFDDRERPDTEVLSIIATWLKETYKAQKQINGIVYLHRITDTRFDSGAAKTLGLFQKVCGGGQVYSRVVFTTSCWNDVPPYHQGTFQDREAGLLEGPWKQFLLSAPNAATTSRFDTTTPETEKQTVQKTLWALIKSANKTVLLLQIELVDKKMILPRTTAGRATFTTEERIRYQLVQLAGLLQV